MREGYGRTCVRVRGGNLSGPAVYLSTQPLAAALPDWSCHTPPAPIAPTIILTRVAKTAKATPSCTAAGRGTNTRSKVEPRVTSTMSSVTQSRACSG